MGLDISYQAMPESCKLLHRSRHDAEFGANLEFFQRYASVGYKPFGGFATNRAHVDFVQAARQVAADYPQIEQRKLDLGRHWDMLHYLLSERRRAGKPDDWSDWVVQALLGGEILHPETKTTNGSPICYLQPAQVRDIAAELGIITATELQLHWNPVAMYATQVYKIHPDEPAETFAWMCEDLAKLQTFYTLAANHGEGVLTCMS